MDVRRHAAVCVAVAFVAALLAAGASAGSPPTIGSIESIGGTPQFTALGGATPSRSDNTVPFWSSSFDYAGTTYPYTMVGTSPFGVPAATTVPTESPRPSGASREGRWT